MKKALILHRIFKDGKKTCLHVINWGEWVGNKVRYETADGVKCESVSEISDSTTAVCNFEDLDIKGSLYHWLKNNGSAYSKSVEIDYSLSVGEVYKGNCWHMGLLINNEGETLKVKPIYQ